MTDPINNGGAVNPPVVVPPVDDPSKTGNVSYATYQRVLEEAKKAKEKARLLEEEKANLQDSKLKEQNEYKTLYEQAKEKLTHTETTLQQQEEAINNGLKYHEFEKHLGGKLKKKDYAAFVSFDKIIINPETKTVDQDSVKVVVAEFLKEHSALVDFPGGPRLPNQAPSSVNVMGGAKPLSELTQAELEKKLLDMAAAGQL